jgi:hypothetical protein
MQHEGSTREFPLSDLMALISESAVTGVLEIDVPGPIGRVFCQAGQIYHAEAGGQTGFDAFLQLVQADDAPFRFIAGAHHGDKTLWADTLTLIGHVRRQELLCRRMRRYIPTLQSVPALHAANGDAEVRLSAALWPALALVDGQRNVAAIAAELGYEPFEVGMLLGQLVGRGLAAIKPPQSADDSDAEQPSYDAKSGTTSSKDTATAPAASSMGFFERLLTGRPEPQPAEKLPRRRTRLPNLIFS